MARNASIMLYHSVRIQAMKFQVSYPLFTAFLPLKIALIPFTASAGLFLHRGRKEQNEGKWRAVPLRIGARAERASGGVVHCVQSRESKCALIS